VEIGVDSGPLSEMHQKLITAAAKTHLATALISHDAGWYKPKEENGETHRGHTAFFEKRLPLLCENHFTDTEIH
jgi:hypothetical protein